MQVEIFLDACLAMLAAVGIWYLGRLTFDALMDDSAICTVVFVSGDALELGRIVQWQLRRTHGKAVLLVDCGLNECGKCIANCLVEQESKIWLCPLSQTNLWVKEAEEWMRIKSKTE